MKPIRLSAIAASFVLVLGFGALVHGEHHEKGEAEDPASQGRQLYLENCASCHGAGAKGNGPMVTSLKAAPPDLTLISARRGGKFNAVEIREMIEGRKDVKAHGSREMPVWGNEFKRGRKKGEGPEAASRKRVHALVEYLESIQAPMP